MKNYICRHSILGMMGKNCIPFSDFTGFYKGKSKDKVVVFDKDFPVGDYKEVNYSYIPDRPEVKIKNMYHLNLLISRFDGDFFELRGKKNKEIRETRNKYNKSIIIKKDIENIEEVIGLINCWDKISGVKYGWQRHSGYDKSFFLKYYEQEKKDLFSLFFYIDGVLVGYSVVSKIMDGDCFRYIIRKFDASFRNICLYIDFKIFENLYSEYGGDFRVSWGASSGNVLKYKKKYPIFFEDKVWFYKIKNL